MKLKSEWEMSKNCFADYKMLAEILLINDSVNPFTYKAKLFLDLKNSSSISS